MTGVTPPISPKGSSGLLIARWAIHLTKIWAYLTTPIIRANWSQWWSEGRSSWSSVCIRSRTGFWKGIVSALQLFLRMPIISRRLLSILHPGFNYWETRITHHLSNFQLFKRGEGLIGWYRESRKIFYASFLNLISKFVELIYANGFWRFWEKKIYLFVSIWNIASSSCFRTLFLNKFLMTAFPRLSPCFDFFKIDGGSAGHGHYWNGIFFNFLFHRL